MEKRLVALKLFLDELKIPIKISTVDDRKSIQKAVYLGQINADLGYRFGWYLMGPYSPNLTKDYYSLAESIDSGDKDFENKVLKEPIRKDLQKIRPLLNVPKGVDLKPEEWLELLASFHYLMTTTGNNTQKTQEILKERKRHLAKYIDQAQNTLGKIDLAIA